jgi:predicted nuclease of predicted toxin-antitoxin system
VKLKLLVDMNLTPQWVPALQKHGFEAAHWSDVGDPRASDKEIMDWAVTNQYVVFTHDMDFGTMLAFSHETGPSVIQIRTDDTMPEHLEGSVLAALNQHESDLSAGALVVVDESRSRVRVLPI